MGPRWSSHKLGAEQACRVLQSYLLALFLCHTHCCMPMSGPCLA